MGHAWDPSVRHCRYRADLYEKARRHPKAALEMTQVTRGFKQPANYQKCFGKVSVAGNFQSSRMGVFNFI